MRLEELKLNLNSFNNCNHKVCEKLNPARSFKRPRSSAYDSDSDSNSVLSIATTTSDEINLSPRRAARVAMLKARFADALELLGGGAFTAAAAAAAALILLGNVIVAEASTSPSAFVQNFIYSTRLPSSPIPIAHEMVMTEMDAMEKEEQNAAFSNRRERGREVLGASSSYFRV
ncbi:hypothetical protein ACE6H2_001725 [Prunus campanulata]